MEINELTYLVNGRAMAVHRELGPGLDEICYHELLSDKLIDAGIEHQFKPRGQLVHRGILADEFEADILIPGLLCPECKAFRGEFAANHFTQVICYQKFWQVRFGILFNFGRESLVLKRVLFDEPEHKPWSVHDLLEGGSTRIQGEGLVGPICQAISAIYAEYGLGYRAKTYRGLLYAELTAEGVVCLSKPVVPVPGRGGPHEVELDCIRVEDWCAVMPLALQEAVTASDCAVLQTYLKHLNVRWGLAVNFGKRTLEVRFVRR